MEIYNSSNNNHTAAFSRLVDSIKRAKQNKRPVCIFIGAGCSLTSATNHSITTEQIIKDCLIKNSPINYKIPDDWNKLYNDFINNVWNCVAEQDRRELLYDCFKDTIPSKGYRYLKKLIENGYIQYILTTNFDMLIDEVLQDYPHDVQVSNLPPRKIKGGSNVLLLKVHGDIENGELRFSPNELMKLPGDISKRINDISSTTCLVCGYRGQDFGVMNSLSIEPNYSSFWASPNLPERYEYKNDNIYKWMESRKSKDNFIYGNILGKFDELMEALAKTLIEDEDSNFIPVCWENNIITKSLKINQKITTMFCNLIDCSEKISNGYDWKPTFPFFAENYKSVLNAYLFFYKDNSQNLQNLLKIPENEVESLLMALAIEIISRTSGLDISALEYAKILKEEYASRKYHCSPDESFWKALDIVLLSINNEIESPVWDSVKSIKLNMNSGGRFFLDVKKPMLKTISKVLNSLNLCSLFCPTTASNDPYNPQKNLKKLLESKACYIEESDNKIVLHFDDMLEKEYNDLYGIFLEDNFSIKVGYAVVSTPKLEISVNQEYSDFTSTTMSEYLLTESQKNTNKFLKLKTAFEFDNAQYVSTPTENAINNFLKSTKSGMFLIGSSGSGKTKTIQHFCENNGDYIISATAAKCGYFSSDNALGLFFNILNQNNISQVDLIKNINHLLQQTNRKLLLIYDGLNEISSDSNECIKQYSNLLLLMQQISDYNLSNCKVIVTCRDKAFLDYCNTKGVFPDPEYCYCNTSTSSSVPYYQIPPLSLELQIEFSNQYIENLQQRKWFISNLKNNRFFRYSFTHPYLIAIAGNCYNETNENNSLFISNVFEHFTKQMLSRLTFKKDEIIAQKVIDTYCRLLISSEMSNPNITTFLLLNSDELYKERDACYRILKELQDINLFVKDANTERIRISHDRIEEFLLSNYLYYSIEIKEVVCKVVKLATIDSIFSCALQNFFNRCFVDQQFELILNNIVIWHNINPQIVSLAFACAIKQIKNDAIKKLIDIIIIKSNKPQQIIDILLSGLKQALSFGKHEYPDNIFAVLDEKVSTHMLLSKYQVHWNYIASKYYSVVNNDFEQAYKYCEKALKCCELDNDLYNIIQLQYNVLKCNYFDDNQPLIIFKRLFEGFTKAQQFEYAAECVLHWGSFLRKSTKFEDALNVYSLIDINKIEEYPQLCSSLYLKIGTAHKNLVQRIIRDSKKSEEKKTIDLSKIQYHYEEAIKAFNLSQNTLGNRISVEKLDLLSEMTETAIVVIPIMPEKRYFADIYIVEEEKLLSYIPIPEHEILYIRNLARLYELDKKYSDAMKILSSAKIYANDTTLSYRLFEINYQMSRLAIRHWEDLSYEERETGRYALEEALLYPLDDENEYKATLIETKKSLNEKLQQV